MIFSFGIIVLLVDCSSFYFPNFAFDACHSLHTHCVHSPCDRCSSSRSAAHSNDTKYVHRNDTRRVLLLSIFRFDRIRSTANKSMAHHT